MTKKEQTNLIRRFKRWGKRLQLPNHYPKTCADHKLYVIRYLLEDGSGTKYYVFTYDRKINEWLAKNVVHPDHIGLYFNCPN